MSTKWPSIAAAAAICGDTRWVRPPRPWRPSKLRLEVDALMAAEEAEIDLEAQVVRFDGREVAFEIDQEIKRRLLEGLDDIGITLEGVAAIDEFERSGRADFGPVTTGL